MIEFLNLYMTGFQAIITWTIYSVFALCAIFLPSIAIFLFLEQVVHLSKKILIVIFAISTVTFTPAGITILIRGYIREQARIIPPAINIEKCDCPLLKATPK